MIKSKNFVVMSDVYKIHSPGTWINVIPGRAIEHFGMRLAGCV